MDPTLKLILVNTLYLLAMINPVSKVAILTAFAPLTTHKAFARTVLIATVVAMGILLLTMTAGEFLLRSVFHVDLYALQGAGGIVLLWVGFNALSKGKFFEVNENEKFEDISVVPLACPMIAGPGTIAAALALSRTASPGVGLTAMFIAITVNMLVMFMSDAIGRLLKHFNVMGALVRITGLVVMTLGMQMLLDGLRAWWAGS